MVVGDDTATLGVAGVAPGAVVGATAGTVVDVELGAPAAGSVVDDVGWTVDVVRGAVVDVLVEVEVDVVVVVAGTHQAGMVVVVVLGGALVVDSGVVLATVVLDGTVVVDVVHGTVVEVVGATVVVVRGAVVDVVGATVVLLLVGGTVVDVVGRVVVVVATTEYEYDTQTVADASMMIRLTWLPLPNPCVWPTAVKDESNVPGPMKGATSAPPRVNGWRLSLVSTGPVSKPEPA